MSNKGLAVTLALSSGIMLGGASLPARVAPSEQAPASGNQQQSSLDQQINMLRQDLRSQ